jgi:predicted lipid-binding transport protein (Tim44 family)
MTNESHINRTRVSWGSMVMAGAVAALTLVAASTAEAKSTAETGRPATLRMRMVADNVVVSPGNAAAPAAAPAPSQTVVVPQGSAPAAQGSAVVESQPAKRTNVNVDAQQPHNYMSTIFVSALMGGLAGGLIGGAVYYLGDQEHAVNIAYWAAGGVLVGTGVGITQVMIQESRVSAATASRFPSDPAPTYRLALLNVKF